ncbi:hypothetical protein C8J57DRAFT_1676671 [Mycena rebaudengoi]|nr:hypothetical protein C8J57DRAFT_1676671 [Mycena rebaudengoi]
MAIAGLDEAVANFAVHPDYRQVSSFALGWVFITSVSCLLSSSLIQRLFGFLGRRTFPSPDAEQSLVSEKTSLQTDNNNLDARYGYFNTALFALPLCFLFASIAQFASLLAFPVSNDATCAFVVAWGGMAAQSGRLVGALIVIFELRRMGVAKWEFWVAIGWLAIGIAFIFFNNAVSVGILTPFKPLGVAFCDRKHFLPASLLSSILYFILEVYAIARVMILVSTGVSVRHVIRDVRLLRPLSLLLLELLTLVPAAVLTNTVAEFVPFSIGAVAVLVAFSSNSPRVKLRTPHMSTLSYATYPSIRRQSTIVSTRSVQQPAEAPLPNPSRQHPFSAIALKDPTIQTAEWTQSRSVRSSRSSESLSVRSVDDDAVVQVGQRARAASHNEDRPFVNGAGHQSRNLTGQSTPSPWSAQLLLAGPIVPSQAAFADRLEHESAQANSLSARPRPTINTPTNFNDTVSEVISPVSRIQGSDILRLSRIADGPGRGYSTRHNSYRTSYRTSYTPEGPSSPDSVVRATIPVPLHDAKSISTRSGDRRRSASVSTTQESASDHRRSVSIPIPERWPTFNERQFQAAGYGRSARNNSTKSRTSSVASPQAHRPPPLPLPLPSLMSPGIRQGPGPRGPRPPPLSAVSAKFST